MALSLFLFRFSMPDVHVFSSSVVHQEHNPIGRSSAGAQRRQVMQQSWDREFRDEFRSYYEFANAAAARLNAAQEKVSRRMSARE